MTRRTTLASRMAAYQAERFPLAKTALMVAAFSAASIAVSARLAGRRLPGPAIFAVAFVVVLVLFFQMRACDEFKDAEDDARYRPERPVPRGLVSLREVLAIAGVLAPLALLASIALDIRVAGLLLVAWAWLFLMTVEFFVPEWLRARPFVYLVSHMAIMPLIDLFVTGCEWAPRGAPPSGLWTFLGLSFANGCVLEIGRKAWAPESEREGVESYSRAWGSAAAAAAWCGCVCIAYTLLILVAGMEGCRLPSAIAGGAILAVVLVAGASYGRLPTPRAQSRVDAAAGAWVLSCYLIAGFAPLVPGLSR